MEDHMSLSSTVIKVICKKKTAFFVHINEFNITTGQPEEC